MFIKYFNLNLTTFLDELGYLSILSQKKSSHGNLRIHKFPVVRKYLWIRNFPVVHKKIYVSVSEAGELGHSSS